ncbi:GPI inositol-deacylase-like [Daphnia pulex]|uniref:GPI inositol-deacylase-like n=1 Tax=Daphnia pulex TaxID=6669 RepID=UPI001EDF7953|nr:GPI inositol-deacylase-like [Daphnia pulex]
MKKNNLLKLLVGSLLTFSFIRGIHRFVFELEDNKCEMTFMFEYPQYIKIKLNEPTSTEFPNYNLFVYGEGEQAERYKKGEFTGIPVLFIPGNAGSYKQVRSLASFAYRKSLDSKKHFHFDFFTIDFHEEFSALYGGILKQQTMFTSSCINRILHLYKSTHHQQKSLLLIGHSMGGMVAKAVFSEMDFDSALVTTIITLATPHKSPVIVLDEDMDSFYQETSTFWNESTNRTKHVALASIGGADRDIQVRSGLTAANSPTINVLTTEMPTVWLAVDHLCIVWCKQVVSTVVRSLFDMVEPSTQNWIERVDLRKEILLYHLMKRNEGKSFKNFLNVREVDFDPEGRWREVVVPHFTASIEQEKEKYSNSYYMIPLVDNAYRDRLAAVASGLPIKYWVFGCVALTWHKNTRFCERGIDLSHQTVLLPNAGDFVKRKFVYLDLVKLKENGFTHIVFLIPKSYQKGSILFDVHRSIDRNVEIRFPFARYIPFASAGKIVVPSNAVSFNVTLPDLNRSWQSIFLKINGNDCPMEKNAIVRKIVPWSHESQYFLSNQSFSVHLHVPKAPVDSEYDSVHLQFISPNPKCTYEIEVSTDWIGMCAQLARFYSPFLLPMLFAIFLYCFSRQLKEKQSNNAVPSILTCLVEMPVIKMALIPEAFSICFGIIDSLHLPAWPFLPSDEFLLRNHGLGFPFMYFILGFIAWSLAIMLSVIFCLGIYIGGNVLHTIIIRYLRSSFGISLIVAEVVAIGLSRIPLVISVALIAIGCSTCGSLALFLGLGVYIWKLFDYFEDELESMLGDEENQEVDDDFHINTTISLLWFSTAILSLPTLVVWSTSPSLTLPNDYWLVPSFVWNICGMMILQKSKSVHDSAAGSYGYLGSAFAVLSVLLVSYSLVSIYRIQYFVTAAITMYAAFKYII